MKNQLNKIRNYPLDIFFLLLILGFLFFILLGVRPLFVPDEGRYAEIVREMIASQNYITPHLNGIKYFEKPILFYWLTAFAIKIGGLNLWSIRAVNALLSILGCLITYLTIFKLYDRLTGLLAAFILGTSLLYFVMGQMVSLDAPVTFFLTLSFYAFLLGAYSIHREQQYYFWLAAGAAALAVLTKGLIGIVFPVGIIFSWLLLTSAWHRIRYNFIISSLFIFLVIVMPWHLLVQYHNPEFFYFYFIAQHFLRFATTSIGHYQPVWFFIPALALGFFPWIVFLPQALMGVVISAKESPDFKKDLFFLLWGAFIFIFFSFSKSKLIPYILPVFPPLAILTARYLVQTIQTKNHAGIKLGYFGLLFLTLIVGFIFYLFLNKYTQTPDKVSATFYLSSAAIILSIGTLTGLIFAFYHPLKSIFVTIITSSLFALALIATLPAIDSRTIFPIAKLLQETLKPKDEIITFNQYYQDLPFYLKRKVSILNWRNELTFGMAHQPHTNWLINDHQFWQKWHSKRRVFVILGSDNYHDLLLKHKKEKIFFLGETTTNVLISNKRS